MFLTQWDRSQHLEQNERVDRNVSSHSTTLCGGPIRCCTAGGSSLLGCVCSAAPASTSVLATEPCQQKIVGDTQLRWQDCSFPQVSCLFRDTTLTESPYVATALQYAEISALLGVCKNGLATVLPGSKISLPKLYRLCGQTWAAAFGYPILFLTSKMLFQAHASKSQWTALI